MFIYNPHIKRFFFLLAIMPLCNLMQGQGKMLTLEDAILSPALNPKGLPNLNFLPSGDYFCFSKTETQKLYIERIDRIETDSSFTLVILNNYLQKLGETTINSMPRISWQNDNLIEFSIGKKVFIYDRIEAKLSVLSEIPRDAANIEWNANKSILAYTKKNNLFIQKEGKSIQLTEDGSYGTVYGEAVHRSEFGITKGLFWSNDGKKLAFYRMDESKVSDYFIFQNTMMPAGVNKIKYPFAGSTSHSVKIGIYDTDLEEMRYLRVEGPEDQYLTNITWSPDNKYLYVAKVSRNQKNMWLERYWVNDGSLDIIVTEEFNEKYVEPENGPIFLPWNNEQFIWQSEKDGYNHLYLFDINGKMLKQLSKGPWVVTKVLGFSEETQHILVEGTKDGPTERHLYTITAANAKIRKLTQIKGVHRVLANSKGNYFLDQYSSLVVPTNIDLLSETGALLRNIHTAENPLKGYALGETSIFPIQNENTTLYARMIKPANFDPSKQYPVLVYVYGGPHLQLVKNSWLGASNLWMQFLAQQGFIVFSIDNRGSADRGFEFESAIYGQVGTKEMEDQLAGVDYLKKLPYVDASRIGVHGWSYGGFMTTSLMTRTPGIFKVGVAGGPVIDWKMYEIMYTERYMGHPKDNEKGYEQSNLLNYADKLEGKLLMIHGTDDDVVLWQHSLLYVQKCVENQNTFLDYFVYPTHKHNVYGKDKLHLMTKITQYLFDNL